MGAQITPMKNGDLGEVPVFHRCYLCPHLCNLCVNSFYAVLLVTQRIWYGVHSVKPHVRKR
jgi:hypothetical protein